MHTPNLGDRVVVRPKPGLLVQEREDLQRFLAPEGQPATWSEWLQKRLLDGSIDLVAPSTSKKNKE